MGNSSYFQLVPARQRNLTRPDEPQARHLAQTKWTAAKQGRILRDKAWVNRILKGDKAAGERLVTENYRRVYSMLRSLSGSPESAEDLTQQAFVRAWQALSGFRGEARLSTWIYRIAYHEYTHWLRDRRECVSLEEAEWLPDPRAVAGLRTVMFARAIQQITPELRETFLLHYERDLSVKEIAVVLDVPAGTVKSRLFTARHRLRELLSDHFEESTTEGPAKLRIEAAVPTELILQEKQL